jgi:ABC-type Fe3+/spermidine/putrescine transport system ATPase subunit
VDVLLRPDDIVLCEQTGIEATITRKVFSGSSTLYQLQLATGSIVTTQFPSHQDYSLGQTLKIKAKIEHLIAFASSE